MSVSLARVCACMSLVCVCVCVRAFAGDTIDIKGPIGHFTYFGNGRIQIHKEERIVKEIGFICGGTGITPAYQVTTP